MSVLSGVEPDGADASDDEAASVKRLDQTVDAILDQFPQRSLALSHAMTPSSP